MSMRNMDAYTWQDSSKIHIDHTTRTFVSTFERTIKPCCAKGKCWNDDVMVNINIWFTIIWFSIEPNLLIHNSRIISARQTKRDETNSMLSITCLELANIILIASTNYDCIIWVDGHVLTIFRLLVLWEKIMKIKNQVALLAS